jgi:predicted nuclease with RNAse H fold
MVIPEAFRLLQTRGIEIYEIYPLAQSKRLKKKELRLIFCRLIQIMLWRLRLKANLPLFVKGM